MDQKEIRLLLISPKHFKTENKLLSTTVVFKFNFSHFKFCSGGKCTWQLYFISPPISFRVITKDKAKAFGGIQADVMANFVQSDYKILRFNSNRKAFHDVSTFVLFQSTKYLDWISFLRVSFW